MLIETLPNNKIVHERTGRFSADRHVNHSQDWWNVPI